MIIGFEDYPFNNLSKIGPKIFISRLIRSIKQNNFAKIMPNYIPLYDVGIYTVLAKNYYNIPYLIRFDGLYNDKKNTLGNSKKLNQKINNKVKKSAGIIFQSQFTKKFYESFFGKIDKEFKIIYNRVDIPQINQLIDESVTDRICKGNKDIVVVVSGSWRRHKRLEETIEFIEFLNKDGKYNFKLLILGETNLRNKIKHENFIFAGNVKPDDLFKWYSCADIYFHPAWIDSAPNTIMEAISCRIPCICCNNGGVSEMLKLCDAGIISNCDQDYNFDFVDLYNPPKPNFNKLKEAFFEISENLKIYKNKINIKNADISISAKEYVDFAKYFKEK